MLLRGAHAGAPGSLPPPPRVWRIVVVVILEMPRLRQVTASVSGAAAPAARSVTPCSVTEQWRARAVVRPAGAARGEAGPGGGGCGARPFPPTSPSPPPASAPSGIWPPRRGPEISPGPEGRGTHFRDIAVGTGCSQSGLSQLSRGREAGVFPLPQIREETNERRRR